MQLPGRTPLRLSPQTTRAVVAGSAVFDLLTRLPGDVLIPLLSVSGGLAGPPWLATLSTWLLFFVVVFTITPSIFTHLDVLPRHATRFRLIFATGTIAVAYTLQNPPPRGIPYLKLIFGMFLLGGIILAYLSIVHNWRVTSAEGQAVEILDLMTPGEDARAEIRTDLAREGWLGRAGLTSYLLAVMIIVAMPAILAAVVLRALTYAYPLLDILVLAWVLKDRFEPHLEIVSSDSRLQRFYYDIESFLFDIIDQATRSIHGMIATMFALLGVMVAAGYFLLLVSVGPRFLETIQLGVRTLADSPSLDVFQIVWNLLGVLVLLGTVGSYALWGWLRELQRLPYFLDYREAKTTEEHPRDALSALPPARVTGFFGLPAVAMGLMAASIQSDSTLANTIVSVGWPLWLVLLGVAGRRTLTRRPQPVQREYWVITSALPWYTILFLTFANADGIVTAAPNPLAIVAVLKLPLALVLLCTMMAVFPFVTDYAERTEGLQKYAAAAVMLGLGCISLVATTIFSGTYNTGAEILAGIGFVAGILFFLVRYYDL
ncbi:hypothetical protein [Halorubellus salinus]|uniref:hypothetical protein n=1 Tax=Halorubellus salinus TaxID=755309 RepID=UPI001D093519|nr:hypothetical protein [Halorubellus salinus]